MQKDTLIGIGAALCANVIFGLNIPVTKALVADWMTPVGYTATRMLFGALAFWFFAFLRKREEISNRDLFIVIIGGLLGYLGAQFMFSKSLEYTTPVIFALLISLTPVTTLIISSIFLHESISARKCIGIVCSISGAFLVILEGGRGGVGANNSLGIALALICVLLNAGYIVLTRKVATKYNPVTIAKWMFSISALALLPVVPSTFPKQIIYSGEATIAAFGLLGFALVFSTTIAFFCMPLALKKLEAGSVSIFMNLQPLVASVVAIGVGQDSFTLRKGIAALLILSGVYLVTVKKRAAMVRSPLIVKG